MSDKVEPIRIHVANPDLYVIPASAATFGFVSGLLSASQKTSLQFLAENAHRQPTTLQGWYFYNKTKNYKVALAGIVGGLKSGFKLGLWTGVFVSLKELCRSTTSLAAAPSGAISGTCMALLANRLYRFPARSLPRHLLYGLSAGAVAGSLEQLRNRLKHSLAEHPR